MAIGPGSSCAEATPNEMEMATRRVARNAGIRIAREYYEFETVAEGGNSAPLKPKGAAPKSWAAFEIEVRQRFVHRRQFRERRFLRIKGQRRPSRLRRAPLEI